MAQPQKEQKPAKEVQFDTPTDFNHWLKIKAGILAGLRKPSCAVYPLSKKFHLSLKAGGDSEEFEEERRAYGLAAPLHLKALASDSEEARLVKENLHKCVLEPYCSSKSNRDLLMSDIPPVIVRLRPEDDWRALNRVGIYPFEAGEQYIHLSHIRTPDKTLPQARSPDVLQHWLLFKEIKPNTVIFTSSSSPILSIVKPQIRAREKDWFRLKGIQGPSTLPTNESIIQP